MNDLIMIILIIALPLMAQGYISISYKKNLNRLSSKDLTGYDVARKILDANGLNDMVIIETNGTLTDHYDPSRKVVRLSKDIYEKNTLASIAVAAHECGHAIQDKEGYFFLKFRSAIFPIVSFLSRISYFVIFLGFILEYMNLVWLGIIAVGAGVFFQIVTLPVEFNASSRALKQLEDLNLVDSVDKDGAQNMLTAAALTYVAGALAEILQLLRLIGIANDRN